MSASSQESRPSLLVEYIARALSKIAGRWPLAEANKGKNSEDPTAEQECKYGITQSGLLLADHTTMMLSVESDPQGYSGKLRISTGLSILQGILNMNSRIAEVNLSFKVFHGTGDRVTNPKGSQRLFDGCSSRDKDIQLYEGYEHVLLRKGKDKQDDERRQRVLKDMLDWLEKRS
jgi:acylglycerol lipase